MENKVLLHACCATCSAYPIELLRTLGYEPVVFFYNPNIFPKEEFDKRLNEIVTYTVKKKVELIIERYEPSGWSEYIKGLEKEPEKGKRCIKCFEYRLIAVAKEALKLGISKFTTTLTVSPYKNSKMIFEAGKRISEDCCVEFLEIDFKKKDGFLKTMKIAKEENFYRQNYCGCEYSIVSGK